MRGLPCKPTVYLEVMSLMTSSCGYNRGEEGVSKVLICYPQYEDERQRNSNTPECSHGSSSASLLLLSRHGYCAPWHDAARQATVSLSAVPRRARAHLSPGIELRRPIT